MAVDPAANSQAAASGSTYTQYVALAGASGHFLAASGPDFFGPYPWALANVVSLGSSDQASLSLQGLNDLLFPVDTWQQDGISVQQLGTTTLLVRGALRGSQVAFEAQTPSGPIAFEQVALIDSPTNQAWDLAVGCSVTCFKAHQAVLAGIVHSFTVTAKGT